MSLTIRTLLFILISNFVFSQSDPPKREFRAAWIATVINLDWPSSNRLSTSEQQEELITMLDYLKDANMNAVLFQIRSECDAMYESPYDPWSYWLTGSQGKAPNPYYDPLEFAVEEAHKRGMELHAWFNPYRAERSVGNYSISAEHVTRENPDWAIQIGTLKFLNPGLAEVRQYVTNVVMDVVTRYDIDGVHFDDYFYPYPPNGITSQDNATFNADKRGFLNIKDWRRDNVNLLVAMIHDSIQVVKPHVKFGISPFGIWRPNNPPGITGLDAYDEIYCDGLAWLNAETVDYITPQLYWKFGGGQDYGKLLPWWAARTNGRHIYPGMAIYRLEPPSNWPVSEITNQLTLNRETENCYGSVFFRAQYIGINEKGITTALKNDYYVHKSLIPSLPFKDQTAPNPPGNIRYERLASSGIAALTWETPAAAADGDSASFYVLYSSVNTISEGDLENPAFISDITSSNYLVPKESSIENGTLYFTVTSLDGNHNESVMSEILQINSPVTPILAYPEDKNLNQPDTVLLGWHYPEHSSSYELQISASPDFSELEYQRGGIIDTFAAVSGFLRGQKEYFWRISASNAAGKSSYSDARSFTTGFPEAPLLVYPTNNTAEIPLVFDFTWQSETSAETYDLQVSRGADFATQSILIDTTGIPDTSFSSPEMEPDKIYFWRVGAKNEFGFSGWSEVFAYKTTNLTIVEGDRTIPDKFFLSQNYPNPFNPETVIEFSVPEFTYITLTVYDLLGREVIKLVNDNLSAGTYNVKFNGENLTSGIYIYVLNNGSEALSHKMMLVK